MAIIREQKAKSLTVQVKIDLKGSLMEIENKSAQLRPFTSWSETLRRILDISKPPTRWITSYLYSAKLNQLSKPPTRWITMERTKKRTYRYSGIKFPKSVTKRLL